MNFSLFVLLVSCTVLAVLADSDIDHAVACPNVGLPQERPGCKVEKIVKNGCTFFALKCDKRSRRAAAKSSPLTDHPLDPGPIPKTITVQHPLAPEPVLATHHRAARAAKSCPVVFGTKVNPGCHEVNGKDAAGCPTVSVECVTEDPPHIPPKEITVQHPLAPEPQLADSHHKKPKTA